jgi:predicted Co/Zn/Cd cation transporter (cation efflux family)
MTVSRLIGVAPEAKRYQIGPGVVEFLSVPMVHMQIATQCIAREIAIALLAVVIEAPLDAA